MALAETLFSPAEPDWTDKRGAEALKAKIEAYWRERGHTVNLRIEAKGFTAALRAGRYDIRSDMVGGLPRLRVISEQR